MAKGCDGMAADPTGRVADGEAGFGVYVHWPFCAAKCPYCDFNSHVRRAPPDQERFAAALAREIAWTAARTGPREVTSVFLGGGTPSLMEPATVGAVLEAIALHWHLPGEVEVTLEANPTSVEAGRFRGYRAAGVNRVSLGVQSLEADDLRALGRLHTVEQALGAIELARATFPRLSFDLIYARPGQTVTAWEAELGRAIDLAADHLSLYQLTIEAGTPFAALHAAGRLHVPDGDLSADLFEATRDLTAARGLPLYEVSNHARPGAESRHNLTYWRYGDYAGIGPGAHGRLTLDGTKLGTATERHPETWLARVEERGHGVTEEIVLDAEQQSDEMLVMGMRLAEGIDTARWARVAGRPLDPARERGLREHGLVERTGGGRLRATHAGMLVLDGVLAELAA